MSEHDSSTKSPENLGIASDKPSSHAVIVKQILDLLPDHPIVLLQGPPSSGRSSILKALYQAILQDKPDMRPRLVSWPKLTGKQHWDMTCWEIIESGSEVGGENSSEERNMLNKSQTTTVAIIDDGDNSYNFVDFWNDLKSVKSEATSRFLLACETVPRDKRGNGRIPVGAGIGPWENCFISAKAIIELESFHEDELSKPEKQLEKSGA